MDALYGRIEGRGRRPSDLFDILFRKTIGHSCHVIFDSFMDGAASPSCEGQYFCGGIFVEPVAEHAHDGLPFIRWFPYGVMKAHVGPQEGAQLLQSQTHRWRKSQTCRCGR